MNCVTVGPIGRVYFAEFCTNKNSSQIVLLKKYFVIVFVTRFRGTIQSMTYTVFSFNFKPFKEIRSTIFLGACSSSCLFTKLWFCPTNQSITFGTFWFRKHYFMGNLQKVSKSFTFGCSLKSISLKRILNYTKLGVQKQIKLSKLNHRMLTRKKFFLPDLLTNFFQFFFLQAGR